jgi:hypothetical protein
MRFFSFINKTVFILLLFAGLGLFLYYKTDLFRKKEKPTLVDRMPEGDFLGRVNIFDFAKESHDMMFYNRLPYREFLSYEFILQQAKNLGLDLQKTSYFFANENEEWGLVIPVKDSAKVHAGIFRAKAFVDVNDSIVKKYRVIHFPKQAMWAAYGKDWFFLYKGSHLGRCLDRITLAKKGNAGKVWKAFLQQNMFKKESFAIYSNWKVLKELKIETAMFSHDVDSVNLALRAYIKNPKGLNLQLKGEGLSIVREKGSTKFVNLNLDITKMTNRKDDPIHAALAQKLARINFPLDLFFKAWEGGLSFQEGGSVVKKETYITNEFDENFNPIEIQTVKDVVVPNYSIMLSMNSNYQMLLKQLMDKGILTKEGNDYRFLGSPQLKMAMKNKHLFLYSGSSFPKTQLSNKNNGSLKYKKTNFLFSIDSLNANEGFGKISFPIKNVISKKGLF